MPASQLVLQFRGAGVEDLDEVLEVEDALFEMLADAEEMDGHDITARARNIYILTDNADATFRRLAPFLERAHLLDDVIAAARALPTESFTLLWPRDRHEAFSLS